MINDAFFLGLPQSFEDKFNIFPPTIKNVSGDKNFWKYFKALTLSQEELEDELVDKIKLNEKFPTPLEVLLNNCYHSDEYKEIVAKAFYTFTHEEVNLLYEQKMIVVGDLNRTLLDIKDLKDLGILNEDNFFNFQNMIREACGFKKIELPDENEDPRVKRIKAKARYRDKIKAKKGMGISLLTCLVSICCMGIGITPLTIGEMSYASIDILMRSYQEKEKYEIDIASLQAGADSKKIKPVYWIRNLE